MNRFEAIRERYGWRWPFVSAAILGQRVEGLVDGGVAMTWLRLSTRGTKGRGVTLGPDVRASPGSQLTIGDFVHVGARTLFEATVSPRGNVSVGDRSWISHDCHISSLRSITIGCDVLIGEFVSLRDSTHALANDERPIKQQGDTLGSIVVEDGAWIGRGCLIQGKPDGVVIGRGAIVGANSVVTRSIPAMEIWGGVPARLIRRR